VTPIYARNKKSDGIGAAINRSEYWSRKYGC